MQFSNMVQCDWPLRDLDQMFDKTYETHWSLEYLKCSSPIRWSDYILFFYSRIIIEPMHRNEPNITYLLSHII